MSDMFGSWLRGPTAETVTLETIGFIKGTDPLFDGQGNVLGNESARKLAKRIGKALTNERHVLDREVRELLTDTKRGLEKLTETPSSVGTGRYGPPTPYGMYEIQKPNPEWQDKHKALIGSLDNRASRIFEMQFLPDIKAENDHV
ncbi:MAG: hypothetical protein AAF556_06010, partial [Pseudomonadota bacterium]